ncbi:MAG: hypothetical protein JO000_21170 [Alphaproteobacteria bacterium]|nr:hypothetical protein [Alphaproteobacteria bacterium]
MRRKHPTPRPTGKRSPAKATSRPACAAIHDRVFDVLISYRHSDHAFAKALVDRLIALDVRSFVDARAHVSGYAWQAFWTSALAAEPSSLDPTVGPGIVVLATAAIHETKRVDHVVREIIDALRESQRSGRVLPISILRFDPTAADELQRRLSKLQPRHRDLNLDLSVFHRSAPLYHVDVAHPRRLTAENWIEVCRAVLHTARAAVRRRLEAERQRAIDWAKTTIAQQLTSEVIDFSDLAAERLAARFAAGSTVADRRAGVSRLAVVGPGGAGKTTLVARTLLQTLQADHNLFFPIVLTADDLARDKAHAVRRRLGLGRDLVVEPDSMLHDYYAFAQGRIFVVTDGLERSDNVTATAHDLAQIGDEVGIWITSRDEAWAEANRVLAFDENEVAPLRGISRAVVAKWISALGIAITEDFIRSRGDFLRNAVFLDIAAYLLRDQAISLARRQRACESSTHLLDLLFDWSVDNHRGGNDAVQAAEDRKLLLERLALLQVTGKQFAIDRDRLLGDDPAIRARNARALESFLDGTSLVIEERMPGEPRRVRLRHDVVDSHNIATLVLSDPQSRHTLYGALDVGFGQIAFEGVIQCAHDRSREAVKDEFFDFFLRMVDNKRVARFKAAGWNSGYVIMARLAAFIPQIASVLGGEYVGDRRPAEGETISALDPPTLTESALSSVGSMFLGARPLSIADPEGRLIGNLGRLVHATRYRARLIEAIARIDSPPAAVDLLEQLAAETDTLRRDQPIALYLADSLQEIAREAPALATRIEAVLSQTISYFTSGRLDAELPVLRFLFRSRNIVRRAAQLSEIAEPAESEAEYLQGLRLHAWKMPRRFSDWRLFEDYAHRIARAGGKIGGAICEPVIFALGAGFWHEHVRCHEFAAAALGAIDHPFARGVLLHALVVEDQERTLRSLFDAVAKQAKFTRARPQTARAFLRAIRRTAAQRHARTGAAKLGADAFQACIRACGITDAAIVSAGMVEVAPLAPDARFSMTDASRAPEAQFEWLSRAESSLDVGPELEPKAALLLQPSQGEPIRRIVVRPATWAIPARAHRAIMARMAELERLPRDSTAIFPSTCAGLRKLARYDRQIARQVEAAARLHAVFEGIFAGATADWPSIAVVHVIVSTRDGKIIDARRSSQAWYAPGRWATSFEEQIMRPEFEAPEPLAAIVTRGLWEEFQVRASALVLRKISLMLEWPSLNPGLVIDAEVANLAREFLAGKPRDGDAELGEVEARDRDWSEASLAVSPLGFVAMDEDGSRHPSSAARLALLRR